MARGWVGWIALALALGVAGLLLLRAARQPAAPPVGPAAAPAAVATPGPRGDPGSADARRLPEPGSAAERAWLRRALADLGLEDPGGRPLAPPTLERLVDLLLERRALRPGDEPPAIERELAVAIDREFERLAGAPPGEVIARLSAGQPGSMRRPGQAP